MFGIKDNWKDAGCYTAGFFEPSGAFTPESDHPTMTAAAERARYLNGGPESVNADLLAACEEALWWASGSIEGRTRIRHDEFLPALRAAIAKAKDNAATNTD